MEESDKDFQSIPFISYNADSQSFQVNPDALSILQNYNEKIGVIAICGKYRTGKSYLLNRLVEDRMLGNSQTEFQNNRGTWFNVGSTVHACTKGLWIMKEPVYVTKNEQQMPVFI